MNIFDVLLPLIVLGIICGSIITLYRISTDTRLKKKLIEKGVEPKFVRSILLRPRKNSGLEPLKWGMVMIGAGIALGMGAIIPNDQLTAALMLVFGGMGFVFYYQISLKNTEKDKDSFNF